MHRLTEMTRDRVREVAPGTVALLPIGSQEQHGTHLPLGTDTLLVEEVVRRADPERAVLCPALPYGFSGHHAFAAALTLAPSTLLDVLGELIDSLVAMGFRRILLVNGHGGNIETMQQATKLAALRHPILAGCCSYFAMIPPDAAGADAPAASVPGHAGWFETSLMLATRPELVGEHPTGPAETPLFDQELVRGLHVERHGEWAAVGGTTDDAAGADAALGERALDAAASALREAVAALLATPLNPRTEGELPQ